MPFCTSKGNTLNKINVNTDIVDGVSPAVAPTAVNNNERTEQNRKIICKDLYIYTLSYKTFNTTIYT